MCGCMFILSILLTYVSSGNVSRLEEAPIFLARDDNSNATLTSDRPNLELSTKVKVPGSEGIVPEDDPS